MRVGPRDRTQVAGRGAVDDDHVAVASLDACVKVKKQESSYGPCRARGRPLDLNLPADYFHNGARCDTSYRPAPRFRPPSLSPTFPPSYPPPPIPPSIPPHSGASLMIP